MKSFVHRHLAALLGLGAFLLYVLTGSRTIQWQDSGQFTLRIGLGRMENDWGLAMVHPLHYMLGRLAILIFPGNVPWAVTGVSALGGALSVGLVTGTVRKLTDQTAPALFAGLTLMLAHSFWRFSGLPEVYTLSAALLMLQILLWVRLRESGNPVYWICLLGANGLSWANHNLALLELAVLAPVFLHEIIKKRVPVRVILPGVAFWMIGSLPYTALIVLHMAASGSFWPVVQSALFGHHFAEKVLNLNPVSVYLLVTCLFTLLSFPSLALPLAVYGGKKRWNRLAVPLALLALHLLFVLRYNVIDQYTFLLPAMAVFALLAGLGYDAVTSAPLRRLAWGLLLAQPFLYGIAPTLARHAGVLGSFARDKPYRDDADYLLHPWTHRENSAAKLAQNAVSAATPGSLLVVEDSMALYAVEWQLHVRGMRDRVEVLRPADKERILGALAAGEPVIRVPARAGSAPAEWESVGEVWRNIPLHPEPEEAP